MFMYYFHKESFYYIVISPLLEEATIDKLILKSIIGIMYAKVIEGKHLPHGIFKYDILWIILSYTTRKR